MALGLALAAILIAGPAGAAGVALPLRAPAGAPPLLADFGAICSGGVTDILKGGQVALARGFAVMENDNGLDAAMMAALGSFSAAKTLGSGHATITINRAPFPDLAATSCMMAMQDIDLAKVDPTVLSAVEGVRGGGGVIAAMMPKAGFYSLVDTDDVVVTISSTPFTDHGLILTMARSVRLDRATGQPLRSGGSPQ